MAQRLAIKNPAPRKIIRGRGKKRVARQDLVVGVPPVRVLDRVGVDVPTAVALVPVGVDRPEPFCTPRHLYHCPSNILQAVSHAGPKSPRAQRTDS